MNAPEQDRDVTIEEQRALIDKLQAEIKHQQERMVGAIRLNIEQDDALKAAMKLIAYLASQQE